MPARLLFIGLWNFCDDYGHHPITPRQFKALIFPGDDLTTEDVRRLLDELSSNGLIAPYSVDGKEFLEISGWHHQKIDRPQKAKFPGPLHSSSVRRPFDEYSSSARD